MSTYNHGRKYYAVSGLDGFGVYTYIDGAKRISEYIKEPQIVQCNSLEQAFCIAIDNYNSYQTESGIDDTFYGDSLDIKLNQILFRSAVRKINQA